MTQSILLMVNGGLGDAVAITPTATAFKKAGWNVSIWALRGNSTKLRPLWPKIGIPTFESKEDAQKSAYDVIACPTSKQALEERATGFTFKQLVTPRSHTRQIAQIAFDIARQMGIEGEPEAAPFAPLTERRNHTPDLIMMGPGVGLPPQAQAKQYPHWQAVVAGLSGPIAFVGADTARKDWFKEVRYHYDWTGNTIEEFVASLARCRLYIGVDNGTGHLVAACGAPTLTIFTDATKPELYTPIGGASLKNPSPEEVLDKIRTMLPQDNWDATPTPHGESEPFSLHELREERLDAQMAAIMGPAGGAPTPHGEPSAKKLSVIITAHNESHQVGLTCENVHENAGCETEIIVVDEGSTDGSCDNLPGYVKRVQRPEKVGVAPGRVLGTEEASGDAFFFLDAHQRISKGCGAALLEKALSEPCIVVATMNPLYSGGGWRGYGSRVILHDGHTKSEFIQHKPPERYGKCMSFLAPGWCISRESYGRMGGWARSLRGWGNTEIFASTAAFFAGLPVYNDREAHCWHLFRVRFPYDVSVSQIRGNALTLARVLYDNAVFEEWWKPNMLAGIPRGVRMKWQEDAGIISDAVWFAAHRQRTDREFFAECLGMDLDATLEALPEPLPSDKTFEDRFAGWWEELGAQKIVAWQDKKEFETTLRACSNIRPKYVLEIGTALGATAVLFSHIIDRGGKIVSLDLEQPTIYQSHPRETYGEKQSLALGFIRNEGMEVAFLRGDSTSMTTVDAVRREFNNQQIDILFIDGGHKRTTALRDWELYGPMVRRGGIVLFHDIVARRHGVYDIWRDLARRFDRSVVIARHRNDFGIGLLQVP